MGWISILPKDFTDYLKQLEEAASGESLKKQCQFAASYYRFLLGESKHYLEYIDIPDICKWDIKDTLNQMVERNRKE